MPVSTTPQPIIIGCGYLGKYLATMLLSHQQSPICIVQSQTSYARLAKDKFDVILHDLDQASHSIDFNLQDRQVYYFAPPSNTDDKDQRMDHFLQLCKISTPNKIVYISTSGVYGDCKGEWVTEDSPLKPISARAKRRVYAENALRIFCSEQNCDYIILRVGGIYGPNRLPLERLKNITVICPEEAPYSNRMHVIDLASACYSAMSNNIQNEVINVADGHSTSMSDYYFKIADFAGVPRPTCIPMSQAEEKLSASMLSFINESRRLSTDKMNRLLNIKIQFPTLELGLEDCFKNQL